MVTATMSGVAYGTYTAFMTLAMTLGVWGVWYGGDSTLSEFSKLFLLGALGAATTDACSAVWAVLIAIGKGKFGDVFRSMASKPGAILMAFGGTRTWHRLACAIEDAGWELRDTMMWPGFWRLTRQHWRTGVAEVSGSVSMRTYLKAARAYVPGIELADVRRGGSGVRAQAVDRDGTLVDDFRIDIEDGITVVRNPDAAKK